MKHRSYPGSHGSHGPSSTRGAEGASIVVTARAPGKVILMGEHAAVYGAPALVAAAGRHLSATFRPLETASPPNEPTVHLRVPALAVDHRRPWREVLAYGEATGEAWRQWNEDPNSLDFHRVLGDDPAHVAWIALALAARHARTAVPTTGAFPIDDWPIGDGGDQLPPSVAVTVESAIPIGSGFGSSAAAAAALVGGALASWGLYEQPQPLEVLEALALEVERRQHGRPSGVDTATVLRGGVLWAQRQGTELRLEAIDGAANAARQLLHRFAVCDSGPPAEATGTVVAAVRRHHDADPQAFRSRITAMEQATGTLRAALCGSPSGAPTDTILHAVRTFQSHLEALGVVPDETRKRVRAVEARGGSAKISGAGSLGGPGAGSVLVYHPDAGAAERLARAVGLEPLEMSLGVPGLEVIP